MKKRSSWKEPEVSDVISWKEPIWAPSYGRRGKPDKIGEQKVTAEVLSVKEEGFEFRVQAVEIVSLKHGVPKEIVKVKAGEKIRRKKTTIEMGLIN